MVVGLDALLQEEAHVLEEASLEEDWLTDLCEESTIDEGIKRFAEFMDSGLRGDLLDPPRGRRFARAFEARSIAVSSTSWLNATLSTPGRPNATNPADAAADPKHKKALPAP